MKTNKQFEMKIHSMLTELEKVRSEVVDQMKSGDLCSDKSKSLQIKSKEIMDRVIDCYYGNDHSMVHECILNFMEHATTPFQSVILWGLPIRTPDTLFVKIIILSHLMKFTSWDGLCALEEVPMFKDNNNCYIDGAISTALMDAHQIPRSYIDKVDGLLLSDNKWIVYATCLYLSSWLGGGLPRGTDLKGFLLKFSPLSKSNDPIIRQHLDRMNAKYEYVFNKHSPKM